MKKLRLSLLFLAAAMAAGTGLRAQEVTRTLMPGWTWISCPTTDTLNLATAMGSFVPMQNDVITTQGGTAVYLNGQWRGNLSKFYPGYGYHYKSNRTEPVTVTFQTQSASPGGVTTLEPTDITATRAVVGSTVTLPEGNHIFARGVCWGTEPNPDIDGRHASGEAVAGSQSIQIGGLNPDITYYVCAYAVTDHGLAYGNQQSFTTESIPGGYVDLGLPSGTLWATCNVGADTPEGYGDYFAWGETQPKNYYDWSTYQYCNGSYNTLTKYCNNPNYGYNGFTDNLTTLLPEDDAATANWGSDWRMPTKEEWQELRNNTTHTWTTQNGVNGLLFTAANGNRIFLPAAGERWENSIDGVGDYGIYWSSSLETYDPTDAYLTGFASYTSYVDYEIRICGYSVRPVCGGEHGYVDLGLPSGTLWATCNVGADTPEANGDYFAWGETQPKNYYDWSTYQYCNGSYNTLTKYCNNPNYGYNGFTDNLTTLLPEDDAATANWGTDWCMPTKEEWLELRNNTTHTWTTRNGVNGRLFIAANGNSIFLPAAGERWENSIDGVGDYGIYWSSSLETYDPTDAYLTGFDSYTSYVDYEIRICGYSVRPVRHTCHISVTAHPNNGGTVTGEGSFLIGRSCTVTATPNAGYVFVNWTENGAVVSTDATYTFTVEGGRNLVANFVQYVDLGLPSGLLWATCNVGADTPEGYGDYFAWGETQPKDTYNWSTYQYCNGSSSTLTKYCSKSNYGYNGFTDNLTTLLPEDDAATANWGNGWRMPTKEEWQELLDNTTVIWATRNGVNGYLFTASNGNSIFLPSAGFHNGSTIYNAGSDGRYWSSSLYTVTPYIVWYLSNSYMDRGYRYYGRSVRPVRSGLHSNTPTGAIDGKFTINDNGDQVYFSQGNLQYQASTNTWKFADNQYDCIGSNNSNISSTYSGWIDLFGWGTSGWNSGNTYYHPWDSNNSNGALYGPSGQYNLTGSYANADWGVYNPISNGGNQSNKWRTLTQSEWNYVFNTRTTTTCIRYAKAKVNNVNGVILLPDDWSSSTYSLRSTNSSDASFSSNTLTASQWSILEQAGAVFLPAAGNRGGASVVNVGSNGCYWSASYYDSYYARSMYLYDSSLNTNGYGNRCYGFSVRLARVVE